MYSSSWMRLCGIPSMNPGIHRKLSLAQARMYGRLGTSFRSGNRSPHTRSSSSCAVLATSGKITIAWTSPTRIDAVVSEPACNNEPLMYAARSSENCSSFCILTRSTHTHGCIPFIQRSLIPSSWPRCGSVPWLCHLAGLVWR